MSNFSKVKQIIQDESQKINETVETMINFFQEPSRVNVNDNPLYNLQRNNLLEMKQNDLISVSSANKSIIK